MRLCAQDTEFRCIKTLTSVKIPERIRSTLLGNLSDDFFHYPPCVAAFGRIKILAKKKFTMPDFEDIVDDPVLDEDFRDLIRESEVGLPKGKKGLARMMDTLDEYRKIRIVYDISTRALDKLESEAINIDDVLTECSESLAKARRNIDDEDAFVHIGLQGNSEDLVHEVLNRAVDVLIKSGFNAYDDRNGGLPEEGVMIVAATTSGGKSAVLLNLLINLYKLAKLRVCRMSLEMGAAQEMARLLSNISGVPFWKIKQGKTSPKEKKTITESFKEFNDYGAKNDCQFSSISPKRDMTIDDALRMVKPFGYDVVGFDYISLFDGVDVTDQWKALSAIVRDCKVFSREMSCLVIVLCQLDDESDRLRYSKGMKEHADIMWSWNYSKKEQRELKVLPIRVDKARDGELFQFELAEGFEVMRVSNMDGTTSEYNDDDDDDDIDLSPEYNDSEDEDDDEGDANENYAMS